MRRRLRNDRGQAIFLAPVGFIIVLLLGGVVLEAGNLHLRQRQLDDLADSVASNAAGAGFDVGQFRTDGQILVDPVAADAIIAPTIGASNLQAANGVLVSPPGGDPGQVTVELTYTHDFIFGRQVFGASRTLTAFGNATLVRSGGLPAGAP